MEPDNVAATTTTTTDGVVELLNPQHPGARHHSGNMRHHLHTYVYHRLKRVPSFVLGRFLLLVWENMVNHKLEIIIHTTTIGWTASQTSPLLRRPSV